MKHPFLEKGILAAILVSYVALGALYAVLTPPWQVPDEPAHYNYVRFVAQELRLPVLRMGDYDQEYLRNATSRRFSSDISIDPIRYESHQPPLYYILAAPIFALFGGALMPLRLFSVFLGAILLLVTFLVGKSISPTRAWPALGMTAFVAFIPQHIAMTAAVENDTLAELLLALILLGLVRWLRTREPWPTRRLVLVGVIVGLALLTKTTVYIAVPLALIAVAIKFFQRKEGERRLSKTSALAAAAAMLLPALILSLPWFMRNAITYGSLDIAGLKRHDQVVVGQLRTQDWIATYGWRNLPPSFIGTTFHSFWAQFGWMAVPIDARLYTALGLLSVVAAVGCFLWLVDLWEARRRLDPVGALLACSGLLTLAVFVGYNVTFYQAQGRYLFTALIPLGLAWSTGWHKILRRDSAWMMGVALAVAAVIGGIKCALHACGDKWRIVINGMGAIFVGGGWFLPAPLDGWLLAVPYLFLAALCAVSPFWFIIPYLIP
jgi:4-amino-4-deoxy-L-arabinose transferase-like glycosyltransferase